MTLVGFLRGGRFNVYAQPGAAGALLTTLQRRPVLAGRVDVQERVELRVGGGERGVGEQLGLAEPADAQLVEQRASAQHVASQKTLDDRENVHPIGGRQRVRPTRDQGHGRVVAGRERTDDRADEGRREERHVDRGDERGLGAVADRAQPGRDPLERATSRTRVLGGLDPGRELGKGLPLRAHDDDRPVGHVGNHGHDMAGERRGSPVEVGLRSAHALRPAAGEHDPGNTCHAAMLRAPPPQA